MSKPTVVLRDRRPAEAGAQWWRMAFNTTEQVEMVADHPDEPPVMTWTFPDGLDEHITPSSVRHRQPSTRLPAGGIANWTGQGTTRVSVHGRSSSTYSWPGGRPTHAMAGID